MMANVEVVAKTLQISQKWKLIHHHPIGGKDEHIYLCPWATIGLARSCVH
jgi:hypothetical protein